MTNLSQKAASIYSYIEERIKEGLSPSVREICSDLNIKSTSTAHKYINELAEANLILKSDRLNRSIRLVSELEPAPVGIPILGLVTAGVPITAEENIEDYLQMKVQNYSSDELFALRVRGDSMMNVGILDGDIIIVYKTPVARNGQIVVALIEDEATVKRFYKENGGYRLQPENDSLEPIYADEVSLAGIVVRSIRDY